MIDALTDDCNRGVSVDGLVRRFDRIGSVIIEEALAVAKTGFIDLLIDSGPLRRI